MDKTIAEAAKLLAKSKTIVITTHLMPDGDGLGAETALFHYLKRLGKKVRIVNPDPKPERYEFLDHAGNIEVLNKKQKFEDFDLAIVVDTNDPKRVGGLWEVFEKHAGDILFFDHHPGHEMNLESFSGKNKNVHAVVDVKSSSIGELLYRLFHFSHDILDSRSPTFTLTPEIALGLYVSIITDTNSFRYARTTALSHRIAADLIDFGLQPEEIYQEVYSTKSVGHLRLIGEVLSRVDEVEIAPGKTIAWVEIAKDVRKKYAASADDTQSIVNFLLLLKSAEILILFREEDDGRTKVSLKSKGNIVVNEVATEFGGGGHEFAAGFSSKQSIKEVREKLLRKLKA